MARSKGYNRSAEKKFKYMETILDYEKSNNYKDNYMKEFGPNRRVRSSDVVITPPVSVQFTDPFYRIKKIAGLTVATVVLLWIVEAMNTVVGLPIYALWILAAIFAPSIHSSISVGLHTDAYQRLLDKYIPIPQAKTWPKANPETTRALQDWHALTDQLVLSGIPWPVAVKTADDPLWRKYSNKVLEEVWVYNGTNWVTLRSEFTAHNLMKKKAQTEAKREKEELYAVLDAPPCDKTCKVSDPTCPVCASAYLS